MKKVKKIEALLGPWKDPDVIKKFKYKDHKFLDRNRTIKSNWARLHSYARDILLSKKRMSILDVGCGNGATMEVFRHYGHKVTGLDKPQIYSPMIESQGLESVKHDGASIPYPFGDNEFDLVICWGAITFFRPVEKWPKILNEFARLSKSTILLAPNVGIPYKEGKYYLDGWKPTRGFKLSLHTGHIYRWEKTSKHKNKGK